MPFIL